MTERETYEHILKITTQLIAEKGFANTSMSDIVKNSGISKGGIYWNFKNKDDIITVIVKRIFDEQMDFLNIALAGEGSADERLSQLIEMLISSLNHIETGIPIADIYALIMRKPELLVHVRQYFVHYQSLFSKLIEQGVLEGKYAVEDTNVIAFIFMSTVEGLILVSNVMGQPDNLDSTLREAFRVFLIGIQNDEGNK